MAIPKETSIMQCAESPVATPTKKHKKLQPSISFRVVSGRAPRTRQAIIESFLWPISGNTNGVKSTNETKAMQCAEKPWPRAKHFSHRSRCLWPLAPQRCAGNAASTRPSVPSCLGNATAGSFSNNGTSNACSRSRSRNVPNHQ